MMKENKFSQFLAFLTNNDRLFRKAVFFSPLITSILGFILSILRGKGLSESLFTAAFLFLLTCFIGIVYQIMSRRNLR